MISVSVDILDKTGEFKPEIRIKGDTFSIAMMLTVLVKRILEIQPMALELHAKMMTDPGFIMEVKDD